jgi:type III restriction enzyme
MVVVDESHNAETELSVDMLKEFNPCFILDLTATPRKEQQHYKFY